MRLSIFKLGAWRINTSRKSKGKITSEKLSRRCDGSSQGGIYLCQPSRCAESRANKVSQASFILLQHINKAVHLFVSTFYSIKPQINISHTHTHTKVYRIINVPFSKPNCSWFIQPLLIDFTKAVYINSLMGPAFCTPRHYLREPGLFHSLASIFQLFFYSYVTNVVVSVVNDVCVCAGELQAAMWCSIKRRRCGLQTGLIRSPPSVSC